jgi:hypothetical protein
MEQAVFSTDINGDDSLRLTKKKRPKQHKARRQNNKKEKASERTS